MSLTRVISLGAGVQSTTMALMAAIGEINPEPSAAYFADTGDEKRGTYRHLDWLEERLPFRLHRLHRYEDSLSEATIKHYAGNGGQPFTPPFFYEGGMLPKRCSKEWKTRAITGRIRRGLGLSSGQRGPKEVAVEVWIGISLDEAHRMKPSEVPWIANRWPLIERRMTRRDCEGWLIDHGFPVPPRSACVYCPFQSDAEFLGMQRSPDDDFPRAATFDRAIRHGGNGTSGPLYVHRSCLPLDEVDLKPDDRQADLFGNECEGMCGV